MAESFENFKITSYVTRQKIRYKTSYQGIQQVREALRKKEEKVISVVENDSKKYSSGLSRQSSETINQIQNWS